MEICQNCKSTLKPNARFCHVCGFQYTTSFTPPPPQHINTFERPPNRQQTYAFIWLFVTVASIFGAMLPFIDDKIDIMKGGGAMIFIGFIMFITGAIVTPFFFKRASRFSNIVSGKNILAYWTYDAAEWGEYAFGEYKKRKKESWSLFWLISIISLVVNIIMCIVKPDGIAIFIIIQFALMLIIGITAFLSYNLTYQKNKKHVGKAIIAPYGIYLNGAFHSWQGLSARFERVQLTDNNTILQFTYSALVRYGQRENYTVNVPIPRNEIATAVRIVGYFNNNNFNQK